MTNHDLDQSVSKFLTHEDVVALQFEELQRKAAVARALTAQAEYLMRIGTPEEQIHTALDTVREQLNEKSVKKINKFQKAVYKQLGILGEAPLPVSNSAPAIENEVAEPSLLDVSVVAEHKSDEPFVVESSAEETTVSPGLEQEDALKEKNKKVPEQIKNLFTGILAPDQIAAIADFDDKQRERLVTLVHDTIRDNSRLPQFAPVHADRMRKLLDGKNGKEIAQEENSHPTTVSKGFQESLPKILGKQKHAVIEKFIRIQQTPQNETPVLPTQERQQEEVAHDKNSQRRRRALEKIEGLPHAINLLFADILSAEQRAAIVTFDDKQRNDLVSLVGSLYEKYSRRLKYKDLQISRLEKILNGVSMAEISKEEGKSERTVEQSFRFSIPTIFFGHEDEIIAGFEKILATPLGEKVQSVEQASALKHDTDEEMERAPAVRGMVAEQDKIEEAHVAAIQQVFDASDDQLQKGISDLFSVERGVVASNDMSVFAARSLEKRIASRSISLEKDVKSVIARGVINRLLYGTPGKDDSGRQWATLSEVLHETPEFFREKKQTQTQDALTKLALQLEGAMPVQEEDPLARRVMAIRGELKSALPIPQAEINQIVDVAVEKNVDFTPALAKGLVELYRAARKAEEDLPENGMAIIRVIATPRPGEPLKTVDDIKVLLTQDDPVNKEKYENGYVTETLLKSLEVMIDKARS